MADEQNTILIVDDDAGSLDILCQYFQGAGFRASIATSAQAALESISRVLPDIILLDVKMPGMDGFEMAARLKAGEDTQDIPIIFVTALSDVSDRVRGLELGAVDYIGKPIHLPEVTARINTHLTIRNLQKRLEAQNAQLERTLEALQESEDRFAAFMDHLPACAFIKDQESRILYVNQHARDLFGAGDWIDKSTADCFPPGLAEATMADDRKALAKGPRVATELIPDKHGVERVYQTIKFPITREDKLPLLGGIALDIHQRAQAETRLAETNQLLETILDYTPLLIAYLDPQFNFIRVNRAYAQADEREPDFFPGKNHFDLYPNAENEEIFRRVLATGEPRFEYAKPFEYAEHPERGVSYWDWRLAPTKDADGAVIGLVLTLAEVTERVQAEEKLRESEARLALAIEATQAALFEFSRDFKSFYTSPRWMEITGYTYEELPPPDEMQRWMLELFHPDDVASMSENFFNFVKGSTERYKNEFRLRHKSGRWLWMQSNGQAIERDEQGRPTRVTGLLFDITERKQAEQERQDLINKLEAQNAELERFAYTISHDLKSPLITIQGFLGLLLEDAAAGNVEQMQADAARISNAATKMGQLLDELLELSRIGRLVNPPERALLGELAREALDLLAGQLREREVRVEIAPNLLGPDGPRVYGDRARLLEVLQNLVDNAIKYMGAQPHPRVEIGARRDADEQVFYVCDNGLGIEPPYQDKVFELFEKLDPSTEGSGVGLAIVKRIVEVHGGRVWVESAGLGQGSTFCFTLASEQ
jgi:PAS domain S-box-containing protein